MDSITQIVLGAAVGEFCLGKKLGNRAMVWGAIAGTIPDLDVISGLWADDLSSLKYHRGFTHSFTFAVLIPFLLAWFASWFYKQKFPEKASYRIPMLILASLFLVLCICIPVAISWIFYPKLAILVGVLMLVVCAFFIWRWYVGYLKQKEKTYELVSYSSWVVFFFWTTVTHPILDAFTSYGTQLFQPFSDVRVAWDTISVVDPLYTVPSLLCLIAASFYSRKSKYRQVFNVLGLCLGALYMALTFLNKEKITKVLDRTVVHQELNAIRTLTTPSIFTNELWVGIVETDSSFYTGRYSFQDQDSLFTLFKLEKDFNFLKKYKDDKTLKTLSWFSNGFFITEQSEGEEITYYDLRFGVTDDQGGITQSNFNMSLKEDENGNLNLIEGSQSRSRENVNFREVLLGQFKRIRGIKDFEQ